MPEDVVLGQISLIVVDTAQWTVFQTDAEGHYLRPIGARGGAEGEYFYPFEMLFGPNGDL